jgi:hypothetical protein
MWPLQKDQSFLQARADLKHECMNVLVLGEYCSTVHINVVIDCHFKGDFVLSKNIWVIPLRGCWPPRGATEESPIPPWKGVIVENLISPKSYAWRNVRDPLGEGGGTQRDPRGRGHPQQKSNPSGRGHIGKFDSLREATAESPVLGGGGGSEELHSRWQKAIFGCWDDFKAHF